MISLFQIAMARLLRLANITGSVIKSQMHELLLLTNDNQYSDTALHCRDGTVFFNRMVVDLLFPWLAAALQQTMSTNSDLALLLPDYQKEDLLASLEAVLGIGEIETNSVPLVIKEEPVTQPIKEEEDWGGQQLEAFPEIKEYEDLLEVDGAFADGRGCEGLLEGGGPFISEGESSTVGGKTIPMVAAYYYCNECEYGTSMDKELRLHIKKVHNKRRFPCKFCNYIATQGGNLKKHVQAVHEKITHACNFCNFKTRHAAALRRHKESQHIVQMVLGT